MNHLRLLPISILFAACAAASGGAPAQGTGISGQYRVLFDSSIRQVDGGRTEVVARDTALLTLVVQGSDIVGSWRALGGAAPAAELPLHGTVGADGVLHLRAPESSNTVVSRECTVDEDGNEACTSSERQITQTPLYTLTVNGAEVSGTLVYLQQGAAAGPRFNIDGRRISGTR